MLDFFKKLSEQPTSTNVFEFYKELCANIRSRTSVVTYRKILDHDDLEWIVNLRKLIYYTANKYSIYFTKRFFLPLAVYLTFMLPEDEFTELTMIEPYINKRDSNVNLFKKFDKIIDMFTKFGLIVSAAYFIQYKLTYFPYLNKRKLDDLILLIYQNPFLVYASKYITCALNKNINLNLIKQCDSNLTIYEIYNNYESYLCKAIILNSPDIYKRDICFKNKAYIIHYAYHYIAINILNSNINEFDNNYYFLCFMSQYFENTNPNLSMLLKQKAESLIFNPASIQNTLIPEVDFIASNYRSNHDSNSQQPSVNIEF